MKTRSLAPSMRSSRTTALVDKRSLALHGMKSARQAFGFSYLTFKEQVTRRYVYIYTCYIQLHM